MGCKLGRLNAIHTFAVSEAVISPLCHSYAVKGIQMRYNVVAIDIAVCVVVVSQSAISAAVVGRLMGRSRRSSYDIIKRVAGKGLVVSVSKQKYSITDKGREVVSFYWQQYNKHRDSIIKLEDERLRRLGIDVD